MRKHLENVREGGKPAQPLYAFLLIPLLSASISLAQQAPAGQSDYSIANQDAVLSRAGDANATLSLAHEMSRNVGIPTEIADSLGFTNRIVQAETAYRNGAHAPLHEADIVNAVNNFATTLGTPAWTQTTQPEVRRLRVRLSLAIPQLFVNHDPPDAQGHRSLLSSNMSPLEAAYVASTMLYVKVFYSDFQFTDAERAQYQTQGPAALAAAHNQREGQMLDIVQGRSGTVSAIDIMAASDQFFNDLGLPKQATAALSAPPPPNTAAAKAKGGL